MISVSTNTEFLCAPIMAFTVTAPAGSQLSKADCEYLQGRVMHERHIAVLPKDSDEVMTDAVRSYEAAKSLLVALGFIIDDIHCTKVDVYVYAQNAEIFVYGRGIVSLTIPSLPVAASDYDMVFRFIIDDDVTRFIVASVSHPGINFIYPVHPSGILSYDMNFPAPTNFRHQIFEVFRQEWLNSSVTTNNICGETETSCTTGYCHIEDPDWDTK